MPPFDFVIVGSGTAGSRLASRLSSFASVLLLESGTFSALPSTPWLHVPLGYLHTMTNPRTSWNYSTNVHDKEIHYPRGRVTGGSSSINGMIYQLGNSGDFSEWASASKSANFSASAMTAAYSSLDTAGWPAVPQRLRWDVLDSFADAVQKARPSAVRTDRMVSSEEEVCGYFVVNQKEGVRVSSYNAFIDDSRFRFSSATEKVFAKPHGKLTVRTQCLVKNLLFDETAEEPKCVGVEYYDEDGQGNVADAGKTTKVYHEGKGGTILCAGSIGSPQILNVSGIGDFDHLSSLAKPPEKLRHHSPGVGANLHDHLQLRSVYRLGEDAVT
ncbi:hypothetical protein TeGR_g15206, partial [Tetraparma gracilis]